MQRTIPQDLPTQALPSRRGGRHPYVLLAASTILCLIPFSGRAFHVDDTLFVWAAKNIVHHPLNPYDIRITWEANQQWMSDITQNPPLASYYAALVGSVFGWSERALHLAFLLPAVGVVLGTYRLAQRFTNSAQLAAFATLCTPGLLVSACSVMCDTMMLAFWVCAIALWMEGVDSAKPGLLFAASLLITICALTKYFGLALIPLLFAYEWFRQRRIATWAYWLLIPIAALIAYQLWTAHLYGHGLITGAAHYAVYKRDFNRELWPVKLLFGFSFVGGCALSGLAAGAFLLPRRHVFLGLLLGTMASVSLMLWSIDLEGHPGETFVRMARGQHWLPMTIELALFIAGGFFVLSLAGLDFWQIRSAESLFLLLWVMGTLFFAAFLNWTLNARSVLPLIPAVGILLARRFDRSPAADVQSLQMKVVLALVITGAVSLYVAAADSEFANSAKTAADLLVNRFGKSENALWFGGHWGFQYYMEQAGARPVDWDHPEFKAGDYVVVPHNNTWARSIYPEYVVSSREVVVPMHAWASTICWQLGAGFYDSFWGPLPYALGRAPDESYTVLKLAPTVVDAPLADLRPAK